MRNVREILRQKLELKRSHRQVARAIGVSNGAVGSLMVRWKRMGLAWEAVRDLDEDELEQRLYGPRLLTTAERPPPDMSLLARTSAPPE